MLESMFGILYLAILGVLDVVTYNKKGGYIPTITTNLYILLTLLIAGEHAVYPGLLALSLAFLLSDLELWGGWADFKLYVGTGIILGTIYHILFFTLILAILATGYKYIATKYKAKVVPFIPVMFISYCVTLGSLYLLGV